MRLFPAYMILLARFLLTILTGAEANQSCWLWRMLSTDELLTGVRSYKSTPKLRLLADWLPGIFSVSTFTPRTSKIYFRYARISYY